MSEKKPKRPYMQYSAQAMQDAVEAVKSGALGVWEAAKRHAIPYQTLKDKIDGKHTGKIGTKCVLTLDDENELSSWIKERAKLGFPIDKLELKDAAAKIAERKGDKKFADEGPSRAWFDGFMKRHPTLTMRTPEGVSKGAAQVTAEDIEAFMREVMQGLDDKGLTDFLKDHPENIINLDESGFELNTHPDKVLTDKSLTHTYDRELASHHKRITVTVTIGADGTMLTPQMIFKDSFTNLGEVAYAATSEKQNYYFSSSQNGWQTAKTFFDYIDKIVIEMRKDDRVQGTIVIWADGFTGHSSLDLQKYCNANNIVFILLLPNATHLIQPLDKVVFKPVKTEQKVQTSLYKRKENKTELNEVDFTRILSRTLKKVVTKELVKKAFESTGIYPLNPIFRHRESIIAPSRSSNTPQSLVTASTNVDLIPQNVSSANSISHQLVASQSSNARQNFIDRLEAMKQEMSHHLNEDDSVSQMCIKVFEQQLNLFQTLHASTSSQKSSDMPSNTPMSSSPTSSSQIVSPSSGINSMPHTPRQNPPASSSILNDILTIPPIPLKTRKRTFKIKTHGIISDQAVVTAMEEQLKAKEAQKEGIAARKRARIEEKDNLLKTKKESDAKKQREKEEKATQKAMEKSKKATKAKKGSKPAK